MVQATNNDKEKLITYLKSDIDNCVYLYIDIKTYDICSDDIKVWFEENDGSVNLVVMKYYDSFQVYSRDEKIELIKVLDLINEYNISMISGPRWIIEIVEKNLAKYEATYGEVFECDSGEVNVEDGIVQEATVDDAYEIAELICSDEVFSKNYKVNELARQLEDRIRAGLGRSYFIRVDGKMVAHTGTFAECDDIVVSSGSVVLREYRKTDYFSTLGYYFENKIHRENKRIYAFSTNKRMIKYLRNISRSCGQYGKLTKK